VLGVSILPLSAIFLLDFLLEQFKNIEKPKYCTIGTVQKSRKTKNTALLEQFINLEK
jgi:hypothetical protein